MTQTTEDSISRVLAERAPSVGAMLLEQVKARPAGGVSLPGGRSGGCR